MPLATLPKEYVSGRDSYEWMMREEEELKRFFPAHQKLSKFVAAGKSQQGKYDERTNKDR